MSESGILISSSVLVSLSCHRGVKLNYVDNCLIYCKYYCMFFMNDFSVVFVLCMLFIVLSFPTTD